MRPNQSKKIKKGLLELKHAHGYHLPLQILFDKQCLTLCERNKITIRVFDKMFGVTNLFTTKCIYDGIFKETKVEMGHMNKYVDIRKCKHSKNNKKEIKSSHQKENIPEQKYVETPQNINEKGPNQQNDLPLANQDMDEIESLKKDNLKKKDAFNIVKQENEPVKSNILKIKYSVVTDENKIEAARVAKQKSEIELAYFTKNESEIKVENNTSAINKQNINLEGTDRDICSMVTGDVSVSDTSKYNTHKESSSIEIAVNLCIKNLLSKKNKNHYILACTKSSRSMHRTMKNVPLLVVHGGGVCEIDMSNFSDS